MIPKIIHYCWFGGGVKPDVLKGCIKSWDKLKRAGYEIREWNEENCDLDENEFVSQMYKLKKYAFVSDYFRLKALLKYGGIYLDTDVYVYKVFDPLLQADLFLGYLYDCALGTAVIGAAKGNSVIHDLFSLYNGGVSQENCVNNGLVTEFFHTRIPQFRLNGQRQSIVLPNAERLEIYPKEYFECGKLLGRSFSLHFSEVSWGQASRKNSKYKKYKIIAARLPINLMAYRQRQKANQYMKRDSIYRKWYYEETGK